jgi:hypothetical protein
MDMKRTLISLCAAAIAAPLAVTAAPALAQDGFSIQFGTGMGSRNDWEQRQRWREREFRRDMRRDARSAYYNGYRGYRDRRAGYVYRDGWWYPAAAFALGAIVGGAIDNDRPVRVRPRTNSSAHIDWCFDRYRSYRSSDNTFQPYNGPRQQCYSPYS